MLSTVRPPLGLPSGSVRALLTLGIVAVVIKTVAKGGQVEPLWIETLMIALAHYFTSRRFVHLDPDVVRRLESEGHIDVEPHPLFLPRHSIRAVLVAAFVGLAVYLYRQRRLFDPEAISILGVVFAYLLGIIARGLLNFSARGSRPKPAQLWEDIKALVVLAVLFFTAGAYLLDVGERLPHQLRNLTLGFVLFYFGSR